MHHGPGHHCAESRERDGRGRPSGENGSSRPHDHPEQFRAALQQHGRPRRRRGGSASPGGDVQDRRTRGVVVRSGHGVADRRRGRRRRRDPLPGVSRRTPNLVLREPTPARGGRPRTASSRRRRAARVSDQPASALALDRQPVFAALGARPLRALPVSSRSEADPSRPAAPVDCRRGGRRKDDRGWADRQGAARADRHFLGAGDLPQSAGHRAQVVRRDEAFRRALRGARRPDPASLLARNPSGRGMAGPLRQGNRSLLSVRFGPSPGPGRGSFAGRRGAARPRSAAEVRPGDRRRGASHPQPRHLSASGGSLFLRQRPGCGLPHRHPPCSSAAGTSSPC